MVGGTVNMYILSARLKIPRTYDQRRCKDEVQIERILFCKVHMPTNALFIKPDKVLKFTLKISLTCSYMFRSLSTTIIRKPSLEPC